MERTNYRILDCMMHEIEDFDIVALALSSGANEATVGVYFRTGVVTFEDFAKREKPNSVVTLKRCNLYNTGISSGVANRQAIELGEMSGDYQMKAAVKIESPDEDMMILRSTILEKMAQGKITTNITRKYLNTMVECAQQEGRL